MGFRAQSLPQNTIASPAFNLIISIASFHIATTQATATLHPFTCALPSTMGYLIYPNASPPSGAEVTSTGPCQDQCQWSGTKSKLHSPQVLYPSQT